MSDSSPAATPAAADAVTPADDATEGDDKRPLIVYSMPGSQFTFKVLAALQARKIEHYVAFVPLDAKARTKMLPSGGTLVPELQVGTAGPEATIVPDSEAILHWLDDHKGDAAQFYPVQPACSEVSERASSQKLAGLVWHYNWVDDGGFKRSMQKSLRQAIPGYVSWLVPNMCVAYFLKSTRNKFRTNAAKAIGVEESELDKPDVVRKLLVDELLYFQSLLKSPAASQPYLIEGTTQPTAADFSVYAQLERLVGEGTASDVTVYPAIQDFKEESKTKDGIVRLWEWYDHMRATCPVQFKGKRPPKDLLQQEQK